MRKESNYAKSRKRQEVMDINVSEVEKQLKYSNAGMIIHGHTHKPGSYELPSGRKRIVLPDWRIFKENCLGRTTFKVLWNISIILVIHSSFQ